MLRTHKHEAKYNVTTEFPNLGLHQAAATGNVGLVKYALSHGQPINSVIDGVLPLHAACSGGSELVVALLIEAGADVNAPRLPRRYSNDRSQKHSTNAVGASGSTPLHFAAANGHVAIVNTLLARGAHPDRPDKHGVTPEMLARQNGHVLCAEVIRDWMLNRDRDLREREGALGASTPPPDAPGHLSKRLRVKRSIETLLRNTAPPQDDTMPKPLGEYTFYPTSTSEDVDIYTRRPSLPHIHEAPPPATRKGRRPRSAGTGAEPSSSQPTSQRRLGSKYSLLNMLGKKSTDDVDNASPPAPMPINRPSYSRDSMSSSPGHRVYYNPSGIPSAVELHNALANASASTLALAGTASSPSPVPSQSPPTRPGILLGHARSSSGGQHSRLRFDSTSTNGSAISLLASRVGTSPRSRPIALRTSASPARGLKQSSSAASLRRSQSRERGRAFESAPAHVVEFREREASRVAHGSHITEEEDNAEDDVLDDDDEDEYGEIIHPAQDIALIRAKLGRMRGRSITSSTSSLSPILSPDAMPGAGSGREFPFSIRQPPPQPEQDPAEANALGLGVPSAQDDKDKDAQGRMRGGSVSSASTSSVSAVTTPAPTTRLPLPVPRKFSLESIAQSLDIPEPVQQPATGTGRQRFGSAGARALGMDLREISSHAQAEALVLQAERRILDLNLHAEDTAELTTSNADAWGMTPLSARLAAYGESLALEKRLKKAEEEKRRAVDMDGWMWEDAGAQQGVEKTEGMDKTTGVGRQLSLDHHGGKRVKMKKAPKVKRPHTSGATTQGWDNTWPSNQGEAPAVSHSPRTRHGASRSVSHPANPSIVIGGGADGHERKTAMDVPDTAITIVETGPTPVQTPIESSHLHRRNTKSESRVKLQRTHSHSSSSYSPSSTSRPRTPDGDDDGAQFGVPLSRVSTAPAQSTSSAGTTVLGPSRKEQEHARNCASANKLARMGFVAQSGERAAVPPRSASISASSKPRFGGLKGLVQSLKGKA